MNWWRSVSLLQIVLTAYWVLIMCVPLGAWNRQPGHQGVLESLWKGEFDSGGLIFVLLFALPGFLYLLGWRKNISWLMWFTLIFDGV